MWAIYYEVCPKNKANLDPATLFEIAGKKIAIILGINVP
jgi:hypothetical protein